MMGGVAVLVSSLLLLLWFLDNPFHGGSRLPEACRDGGTLDLLKQEAKVAGGVEPPCNAAGSPAGHHLLSAHELGARPPLLCGDPRRDGSRGLPWPPRSAPFGAPQGAVWGSAGGAARRCRAASRFRSVAGGLPLRGLAARTSSPRPTRSARHTCGPRPWRSRSAAARSTCWSATRGAPCASRTRCRAATRPMPPAHRRSGFNAGCGASPESARRGADRQRATPLRRDAQRDDRRGDRARRLPQQPGTDRRPGARGAWLRPRPRAARRLPGDRRKGRARGLLASALVAFLLLVTADLDRPTRGLIQVPDAMLRDQLASMKEPPAATAPRSRSAR